MSSIRSRPSGRSQESSDGGQDERDEHGGGEHEGGARALRPEEKTRLAVLALPTLALALSLTMVSTYLSTVTRRYTHQAIVIGIIIGGEGVMALWVPLVSGPWSDRLRTRIGGRLPFIIIGAVPAAIALALVGFVHSLGLVALVAALFFAFYFVAYEPYRAMYPDLFEEDEVAGRSQSTQAVARGLGTALALLGGGLLLTVARPLPFVVAALVLVIAVTAFVILILRGGAPDQDQEHAESVREVARSLPRLILAHPALRAYMVANALWETALSAMKAFVILYLTIGLHMKLSAASLIIGGVAFVILFGAGAAGKAGDKFGRIRVVRFALVAYGLGYLVMIFTTSKPVIVAMIPFIALGGGAVMTLAYAILMPLMPEDAHGALSGFYSISRGLGIVAGPILAGVVITLTRSSVFKSTQGFEGMWIVCAAAALLSLLFVHKLKEADADRQELKDK